MWSPIGSAALVAAIVVMPVAFGQASAAAQDFSITAPAEPANPGRRDLMRQLQAWWDLHGYYPRHASNNDEGGTVKIHLVINPDGRIWQSDMLQSSGSASLDAAAATAFRYGFVRAFPDGVPEAAIDLSLHYVLAHRHDQPVAAGYRPAPSLRPFTIANDPVTSPILETMLQRTCTGTVVKEGIRNHPMYGGRHWVQAVFFRRPEDNTPWVRFYDGGEPFLAPVNQVGKAIQWTGPDEHPRKNVEFEYQYTVWPDGDNKLGGSIQAYFYFGTAQGMNTGGYVDFTCSNEIVPAIPWRPWAVKTYQAPPADPP